jgi:hypothetical protein
MTFQIFLFQLVVCLILALALLWRLCWLLLQPSHSQAGRRRTMAHHFLKPPRSTQADTHRGLCLSQSTVPVLWNH